MLFQLKFTFDSFIWPQFDYSSDVLLYYPPPPPPPPGGIIFITVCLPVCLPGCFLAGWCKYYWMDLPKNQMGLSATLIPVSFEGDLYHQMDRKNNNTDFPIYLLFSTPWWRCELPECSCFMIELIFSWPTNSLFTPYWFPPAPSLHWKTPPTQAVPEGAQNPRQKTQILLKKSLPIFWSPNMDPDHLSGGLSHE